ncbi:MAG: Flp pilus assembly protein TadB [Halioglobus sp.]|jgi:Flp pilus assembly protein TadB
MTDSTQLIMFGAAFSSVFLLVLYIGLTINETMESRENEWAMAKAVNPTWFSALTAFLRDVLFESMMKYPSIQRQVRQAKVNLGRAGIGGDPGEVIRQSLWEGLIVFLVGSLVMLVLVGLGGILLAAMLGAMWAFWIKPSLLNANAEQRSRAIYRRIPYALDLSVLVLETGGTLREGLEEIAQQDDPLAQELNIALLEMDSGASQGAALKNLGQRVGLESLETILIAINRGDETGAPMVETLITQAEMFRSKRLQEIERLAVEAPTKMTFPNMMIMFSVLLLIVGPLLIQLVSSGMF